MHNVTIVGTEDGVLVLATETGERFALPINDLLRRAIQHTQPAELPRFATINPREIQKHIRAGLTAEETAELLSVPLDDVERFAGPVIAEREHVIDQALAAPVLLGGEINPGSQPSFGSAIRARLLDLNASEEHWASWKDERGWTIKLEFVANEISHDARWSFDPRSSTLAPSNDAATQLSRQGAGAESLIPRLRALETESNSPYKDDSRFDSGAFGPRAMPDPESELVEFPRASLAAQEAAMSRAPEEAPPEIGTADLLEALRRRRGQREGLPMGDEHDGGRATTPIALFDAIEEETPSDLDFEFNDFIPPEPARSEDSGRRRRRETLPAWDDIVFGTRSDD